MPGRTTSRSRCVTRRPGKGCSPPWPWKWIPATASSPHCRSFLSNDDSGNRWGFASHKRGNRLVRTVLRTLFIRSTYARHRIREWYKAHESGGRKAPSPICLKRRFAIHADWLPNVVSEIIPVPLQRRHPGVIRLPLGKSVHELQQVSRIGQMVRFPPLGANIQAPRIQSTVVPVESVAL